MTDIQLKKLKDDLWHSADMLRASAHLAANKYGQPILGLIFLRYADILFKQHKAESARYRNAYRHISFYYLLVGNNGQDHAGYAHHHKKVEHI